MSTSIGRDYHHGDLRATLVGVALDLLAEDGPEALSLRAVARRAGVSAMAPYRHYADKEALLAAVACHGFEGLRDALHGADEGAAPEQALVAQGVAYVGYALDHPALFRLMFGPKRNGCHPGLAAAGEAAYDVLARRVRAQIGANAEVRALGCWALVHGLASLLLDGQIGDTAAFSADDMTLWVAQVLNVCLPPA